MPDFTLDCRGLPCPKPLLEISRRMAAMLPGQTLRVEATDPAFPADLKACLTLRGEGLQQLEAAEDHFAAILTKR